MSQRTSGGYRGRGRPGPYRMDRPKQWRQNQPGAPGEDGNEHQFIKLDPAIEQNVSPFRPLGVGGGSQEIQQGGEAGNGPSEEGGPTPKKEKKFSNKARLFVGNLPRDTSEAEVRKLFEPCGEVHEVFLQKERNFGFVRMAYRGEAERAIATLNGHMVKGRDIKVRFAASSCSVKVSNLSPMVSNELLEEAFSTFGEVESAVVVTDERGKSLGYGIVDYARRGNATGAIQRCRNGQFLLTKAPIPVIVAEFNRDNDDEGLPEKSLLRNNTYFEERELPPRFAQPSTLEYAIASKWKQAYEDEKVQRDELEQRLKQNRNEIQNHMEVIKEQHRTDLLRQEFARHQQEGMRLAEQLRQRGESYPRMNVGGAMPGLVPPPTGIQPPPSLLQQPPLTQQIPALLFPPPGAELKTEARGPLEAQSTTEEYLYGNQHGGAPPLFGPPAPLMGQKFH